MVEIIKTNFFGRNNITLYCITDDSVPLKQGDEIVIKVREGTLGWFYISKWSYSSNTDIERRKVLLAYEIRNNDIQKRSEGI